MVLSAGVFGREFALRTGKHLHAADGDGNVDWRIFGTRDFQHQAGLKTQHCEDILGSVRAF
jgi:hypothetical protein